MRHQWGMSHRKNLQAAGTYQHPSMLRKHHQSPLQPRSRVSSPPSQFLLRIESHCDSVRDKSRCVLASPAAPSIATGAFTVSSMGRVIWLKNKQQRPEERQDSWPFYWNVVLERCHIVNTSRCIYQYMLHLLCLPAQNCQDVCTACVLLCWLMTQRFTKDISNNRRVGWGFHA